MLNIIGLGLNETSITKEALEAIKKSKKTYLESYTVEFPYSLKQLEKTIKNKIIPLGRNQVESDQLINEAKKQNISLLVYGSPLFATTHISILDECRKRKIKTKIFYNASVFDAIAETGLQLYKFGKISSMPKWQESFKPTSFLDFVKENQSIQAHSLILIDIGMSFKEALEQFIQATKEKNIKLNKILVCSQLGTKNAKTIYSTTIKLKTKTIKPPFCFMVLAKMHFLEEDVVKTFSS
jgi:diphthine methyl ester synthase